MDVKTLLLAAAALSATFVTPAVARATPLTTGPVGLINDCMPTAQHPYPVVLVHGQAGDYHGMNGVSDRLHDEGFCVYATNYGSVNGSPNGQDHLWTSADQISAFIDSVMKKTGAKKVDVVGHSAGTGVLDNYILKKGGAAKVHAMVSFGGLHHPYAHAGVPRFADFDVHLPNLLAFGQKFFPGLSIAQITHTAVSLFGIEPGLASTIESNFAQDLFDASYWNDLQGGPSEPPGTFVRLFTHGRTLKTHDADASICTTNIVAVADLLVGGSTGWQDESGNVENFLLTSAVTANAHNDMLGDGAALSKMVEGLAKSCNGGGVGTKSVRVQTDGDAKPDPAKVKEIEDAFIAALERDYGKAPSSKGTSDDGGCAVRGPRGTSSSCAVVLVLGLGLVVALRRRTTRS